MSDEPKSDDKPNGGWVMPDPVFRSTPGHTPNSVHENLAADDITTQPGFTDEDNIDTLAPDFADAEVSSADELVKVTAAPPKPKKRGCASNFLLVVGVIALVFVTAIVALVYFLYPRETGPF